MEQNNEEINKQDVTTEATQAPVTIFSGDPNDVTGESSASMSLFAFEMDRKRKKRDNSSSSTPIKARAYDELVNCAHPGCPYATTRVKNKMCLSNNIARDSIFMFRKTI